MNKSETKFKIVSIILIIIFVFISLEVFIRIRTIIIRKAWVEGPYYNSLDPYEDPKEFKIKKSVRFADMVEYNTYLGFITKANYKKGKYYKFNKYHFRYNEDFPIKKEKGEFRIFITGGSAAMGWGVSQKKVFSSVLENMFKSNFPYRKIRVINSAIGAYCSTQERIMVENRILQFQPDFIIMFSGWNDAYLGYRGINTLYDNDYFNYRKLLDKSPMKLDIYPPDYGDFKLKTLYVLNRLIYKIKYGKVEVLEGVIKKDSLKYNEVTDILLKNIHILSDMSKRYNYKLIFYLQPNVYSTEKKLTDLEKVIVRHGESVYVAFPGYHRDVYSLYRRIFPEDARENGYYYIDGDGAIRSERKTVFFDHVHLSDRGNRLVAVHLYNELDKLGFLK